jgi:hypothetical protein
MMSVSVSVVSSSLLERTLEDFFVNDAGSDEVSLFIRRSVMSKDQEQNADTNSAEFKEGVEAGLNSDTKNWTAGYDLGQELKEEGETKEPIDENPFDKPSVPLFMRDREGDRGNAQDEKDETEE